MSSFEQPSSKESGGAAAPMMRAAGCGFFGRPATLGFCSVCYKKHTLADSGGGGDQKPAASSIATASASSSSKPGAAAAATVATTPDPAVHVDAAAVPAIGDLSIVPSTKIAGVGGPEAAAAAAQRSTRCAACRKKVGLVTGFACRCGSTFCGVHRHAEDHGCVFDFKAAGRAAIARDNPVVKGEKMPDKI